MGLFGERADRHSKSKRQQERVAVEKYENDVPKLCANLRN